MAFSFPKPSDRLIINNSLPVTSLTHNHITPSNQYGWTIPTDKQSGQGAVPHFQHKKGDSAKCSVAKSIVNNDIGDTFKAVTSGGGLGGAFEQMMLNTQLKEGMIQVKKNCI